VLDFFLFLFADNDDAFVLRFEKPSDEWAVDKLKDPISWNLGLDVIAMEHKRWMSVNNVRSFFDAQIRDGS